MTNQTHATSTHAALCKTLTLGSRETQAVFARLDCEVSVDEDVAPTLSDEALSQLAALVIAFHEIERPCLVSVSWVSDKRMQEINAEWRDVERPTDVISLECERPDDPDLAPGEPCELGDIILAPAVISEQAERFATTVADETRLLFVHGMLHLLGYDHLDDASATALEALEERILAGAHCDAPMDRVILTRHREDERTSA